MTGHWPGGAEQGPDRDDRGPGGADRGPDRDGPGPVEEFFAAHRAQIREEPPDELTWQRVRDGRRREHPRRSGAWAGALVAAAAASAFVFGPSLIPDTGLPDPAAPATSVTGPTATDPDTSTEPTATDGPGEVVRTPVPEGDLPEDGQFTDTTTADPDSGSDTGMRYGLVIRPCETNGWCSVLATSEDGGLTWVARADLEELGMVHRVLFTDHRRGWVWGDKAPLWTTTDGGQTWAPIALGATAVQDVSVRDDVLLATTLSDDPGVCTSSADCPPMRGAAVLTDPTDQDWTDDVATDLGRVGDAAVLDTGTVRYVTTTSATGQVTSLRLQDGRLETMASLTACGSGPVAITASRQDAAHLWALCDDERGLALQQSENGGRTWLPANLTVPSFVLGERPPLMASTSADHLLLVGQGNFALTTDGGASWSSEEFLPDATGEPDRLEVNRMGEVIVYPTPEQSGPDLGYWQSVDGGASWQVMRPRG